MAKDPAILWYYADYLNGTEHMSFEEQGAYMRLMCKQADKGHLSIEFIQLVLGKYFKKLWPAIQAKFQTDDNGNYFQHRVESEKVKRENYIKRQSENGKKKGSIEKPPLNHGSAMAQPEGSIRVENRNEESNEGDSLKGDFLPVGLVPQMLNEFLKRFPKYPQDKEIDFAALLDMSYKIGQTMGFEKAHTISGGSDQVLKRWIEIVDFIRANSWYSSKAISFLNKDFQGIIQGMESAKPHIPNPSEVKTVLDSREKQNAKLKEKYN